MKAILIDDEPLALDFLERQLHKISDISIVHKFVNFNLDKDATCLESVDIVFLDIEMPENNGLELAEKILEIKPSMVIVFVTAFREYAVRAFELNTLDYIVKPVQLDRLKKTLTRIENSLCECEDEPRAGDNELNIHVCGELSFQVAGGDLQTIQWRTTKARELFLYLLLHVGKTLRKSELAELLWPEADFSSDYSQLYTAIYHVRKKLRTFNGYFSLKNITDGYRLTIQNTSIDIVTWESNIKSFPHLNEKTIHEYEKTMELYTGAYLEAYDYMWADTERYRLELLWIKTAQQMADFYFDHDDLEKAEIWYARICALRPEEECSHFQLMKIYDHLGYGILVDHQFLQLRKSLDELDIRVSPHIQKWYNEWLKQK